MNPHFGVVRSQIAPAGESTSGPSRSSWTTVQYSRDGRLNPDHNRAAVYRLVVFRKQTTPNRAANCKSFIIKCESGEIGRRTRLRNRFPQFCPIAGRCIELHYLLFATSYDFDSCSQLHPIAPKFKANGHQIGHQIFGNLTTV
jgi:hypothetical protein